MNDETMENQEMTLVENKTIFDYLPFAPTMEQKKALYEISEFVDKENDSDFYILAGAAGTGKTSMLKAVVEYLVQEEFGLYLCAPTAQAAKVLASKTGHIAQTIQKVIYNTKFTEMGQVQFLKKQNDLKAYTVFLVDEASMVSDVTNPGMFSAPNGLLTDLIDFVKAGNSKNKIIFIGDRYQLPPVNESIKALDPEYLSRTFKLESKYTYMTEVKRQGNGSEVLNFANAIRAKKDAGLPLIGFPGFHFPGFGAIVTRFKNLFSLENPESVVYIAATNRNVNYFNGAIRVALGKSGKIAVGDFVLLDETIIYENQQFPKGERGVVVELGSIETKADLSFVFAAVEFRNSEGNPILVRKKVMLDWITEERDGLSMGLLRGLAAERNRENPTYRDSQRIWDDEYLSALRLRFAYGITCHKAQGSEWDHVLIHPWFRADDHAYLYTAITRARKSVASFYSSKPSRI
jgi:exodeoxyribonuclease-5